MIICHHANCPDGLAAATWLAMHVDDYEVELIACDYGRPLELDRFAGQEVAIVDWCPTTPELNWLHEHTKALLILDHHDTAADLLAASALPVLDSVATALDHPLESDHFAVLDRNRSGAGLAAELLWELAGVEHHDLLAHIEDRDLWRFNLTATREIMAAVTSHPYTREAYEELLSLDDAGMRRLLDEGTAICRYRDQLVEQVAADWVTIDFGYGPTRCSFSPYTIGSDVAGLHAEAYPHGIGAYAIAQGATVKIGLRSTPDGPTVNDIARSIDPNGGGHPHASGCRVTWETFNSWLI